MAEFTHFNAEGNAVMVDVSDKEETGRMAVAFGSILINKEAYDAIKGKKVKKGDVLGCARIAGIMSAKRTYEFIPLCHPLMLTSVSVDFDMKDEPMEDGRYLLKCICTAKLSGKTGVEMEALCGVSTALLTIYDMCKAIDRSMEITGIKLLEKSGGRSGHFVRDEKINYE